MTWLGNLLVRRRKIDTLQSRYEQLEFKFQEVTDELVDFRGALKFAQTDADEARAALRESELARTQLEFDLGVANARIAELEGRNEIKKEGV